MSEGKAPSAIEELLKLSQLRADGTITEAEFISLKSGLLDQGSGRVEASTSDLGNSMPSVDTGMFPDEDARPGFFSNFISSVTTVLRKYATFSGRARRSESWYWFLFVILGGFAAALLDKFGTLSRIIAELFEGAFATKIQLSDGVFSTAFDLATSLPSLAVNVRRLHDIGRSGWWGLILFLPLAPIALIGTHDMEAWWWLFLVSLIGPIVLFIWSCQKGTDGDNEFGPNPLVTDGLMKPHNASSDVRGGISRPSGTASHSEITKGWNWVSGVLGTVALLGIGAVLVVIDNADFKEAFDAKFKDQGRVAATDAADAAAANQAAVNINFKDQTKVATADATDAAAARQPAANTEFNDQTRVAAADATDAPAAKQPAANTDEQVKKLNGENSITNAGSQPPSPWQKYVGASPAEFVEKSDLHSQFQASLGDKYDDYVNRLNVSSGMEVVDDTYLVGEGCVIHACAVSGSFIVFNMKTQEIFAATVAPGSLPEIVAGGDVTVSQGVIDRFQKWQKSFSN